MSAVATAGTTPCPCWWPADGRRPDTRPRRPIAADISVATSPARPHGPGTGRPDGGHSGSSGRSIRRSFRLVTTTSTLPQGRPCGRPPARQRHDGHLGNRPHRPPRLIPGPSVKVACLMDELRSSTKYLSGEGPCALREATASSSPQPWVASYALPGGRSGCGGCAGWRGDHVLDRQAVVAAELGWQVAAQPV